MALTIRLSDEETKALKQLMINYETKTQSGCIKKIILSHKRLINDLTKAKYSMMDQAKQISKITNLIQDKVLAEKRINEYDKEMSEWAKSRNLPF